MFAGQDFRALGRSTRELDRGFDCLGSGIGKENLVEIGRLCEQSFRKHAGQRRDIHLDKVGQFRVQHALERGAQRRMVPADAEHPEAAEQVEIPRAGPVIKILAGAAAEAHVVADGPQHPDHLLIQVAAVQVEPAGLLRFKNGRNVVVVWFQHRSSCYDWLRRFAGNRIVAALPPRWLA